MKKGILLICLFAGITAYSQDFDKMRHDQRVQDSLAQISAGNSFDSNSSTQTYLSRFIGYDYNKVMPGLQMFLQDKMSMASVDALSGMNNGWLKIAYTPQVDDSKTQRFIYIMAKMDAKGLIQQMRIKGDWDLMIPLFCDYWPTKLNFNNLKKGEVVSVYNLNEKITLSSNNAGNDCIITVKKI